MERQWRSAGVSWAGGAPGLRWEGGAGSGGVGIGGGTGAGTGSGAEARARTGADARPGGGARTGADARPRVGPVSPLSYGVAGGRVSYGREIGFRVVGERRCVGVRGNPCPYAATVAGRTTQAQCADCARLDRSRSVAADTMADDPRPYAVYLAWFGPGLVKVGITREDRGPARLLEQGAVAFSWLGRGPLMSARRCEELLRAGLGVPDRISYAKKRRARAALPGPADRASEVRELHAQAVALTGWPEALAVVECEVVDHAEVFGLVGLPEAAGVVSELVSGGSVAGRVVAVAGPDLHVEVGDASVASMSAAGASGEGASIAGASDVTGSDVTASGGGASDVTGSNVTASGGGASGATVPGMAASGVVVVDSRLLAGWALEKGDARGGVTVPVKWLEREPEVGVQEGLF